MCVLLIATLVPVCLTLASAVTTVCIIRMTISGTESKDRAQVLTSLAHVIHAIRGSQWGR
jgi:hypothetical protein